jgi:hypothetical protein
MVGVADRSGHGAGDDHLAADRHVLHAATEAIAAHCEA